MKFKTQVFFLIFSMISSYNYSQNKVVAEPYSLPLITTFTPSEYHGGIQNWSITQDTTGYLYIANNYGLLRFNGATWQLYEIPGSTKARSLAVQKSTNRIYVGGQRQLGYFKSTISGLNYYDLTNEIPGSVQVDEVWDLLAIDSLIIANVNGQILFINDGGIEHISGVENVECISLIDGLIMVGTPKGIYSYDRKTKAFIPLYNISAQNFRGIERHAGALLFLTYDGEIFEVKNEQLIRKKLSIHDFLIDAKINRSYSLKNGNLVLGTQNNGLIILDQEFNPIQHLTKNKGLNHRTVVALYEDDFDNLWVGLNNGICSIELGSPFSLINENVGLEGTGYAATSLDGMIYLGTSSGLFQLKDTPSSIDNIKGYEAVEGSEGLVNNISVVDDYLILGHHEGAFIYDTKKANHFFEEIGTWGFKKTPSNKILGGSYSGFYLFDIRNDLPANPKKLKGLSESSRIFEFENDTILWMTHGYKGAYKIDFIGDSIKSVKRYGATDGFPSNILISVYKIDDELIFTGETGIYVYNPEKDQFEPHSFLNEWFLNKHVSKIREADNGQIYFIANGEVGVLSKKSIGVYELEQKPFKKINDLLSDDLENINIISNEEILIGAKEGFVLYQPKSKLDIHEPYHTYLTDVYVTNQNDSTQSISGEFFTSVKTQRPKVIRFNFAAPFFDGVGSLTYSYRLIPYEENWSEWTTTNWKEYTNLPASDYTVEIKSKNVYGDESKVSSYSFVITPLWYESDTAYLIYAGTLLFIFTMVIYTREKKHKTEKQIIHQSKDDLIRTKEREISEFSEKTTQQIQALKNENLKKEIDHKNSQLASVTMHLLSKNEFVMSIRKKLNDVASTGQNESLQRIVKSIDRNIDEDEAWETFVHHFDQVHGNFLHKLKENINLTPQETKLCAYLKMNMSTKDIANLMNITVRGVELGRYRLRKKLGINRDVNLVSYLEQF